MVEFTLFDFYDKEKERPVKKSFKKCLTKHEEFDINDVTYRVVKVGKREAVIRMIKYKIANTATQFVHKCPAKKDLLDQMSSDDIIKLEKAKGKKESSRVKMSSHAKIATTCPHCKTEFWKEHNLLPDTVQIAGSYKRKSL